MTQSRFADLDPSQSFERGWNRLQLGVEVLVGLIVLAGLAGLFGSGPLSSRTVRFDTLPMTATYERVLRRTVSAPMTLRTTDPLPADTLEVELPNELIDAMDVTSTSPRSTAMRAEADGIVYVFQLGTARRGTITFSMKPRKAGIVDSSIRSGSASATLRLVALP